MQVFGFGGERKVITGEKWLLGGAPCGGIVCDWRCRWQMDGCAATRMETHGNGRCCCLLDGARVLMGAECFEYVFSTFLYGVCSGDTVALGNARKYPKF